MPQTRRGRVGIPVQADLGKKPVEVVGEHPVDIVRDIGVLQLFANPASQNRPSAEALTKQEQLQGCSPGRHQ
jgi:hypothetical protein